MASLIILWFQYYAESHALIFVVDSSDRERIDESKEAFSMYTLLLSLLVLKRHGPFVAFNFYCKIMLYGINYTYYSVKTAKYVFMYHLGVENKRSKGA